MLRASALASLLALGLAGAALAAGGGGGGSGGFGGSGASPQQIALAKFEEGEKLRKTALETMASAQGEADAAARGEALEQATAKLKRALRAYKDATRADRKAYFAWNGLGFCQRMLGDDDAALASYDRALKIKPDFAQAVEYRGEAYLNLGKLDEAKSAYIDLFGRERALADLLLRKMQAWVAAAKQNPQSPGAQERLDAFASWVEERAVLAQQTASLAPTATVTDFASW